MKDAREPSGGTEEETPRTPHGPYGAGVRDLSEDQVGGAAGVRRKDEIYGRVSGTERGGIGA